MAKIQRHFSFDHLDGRPKHVTTEVIRAVCDRLVEKVHPEKIILFGSQAGAMAKKNSDLDLLVIIDHRNPLANLRAHDRYSQILRLFPYRGFGLDAFVLTNKEVQKMADENEGEWDLILEILAEGTTLYDQETKTQ